ncbi:LVIVD repeat-containing protein [Jiangella mangrovi]|uniref:DUF839 domain-containing protein n=1 Tax=Jiangella mangrovi TaxID=1524084 RepID=A0A7W9GRW6_9ACTN|nr:hypothetical protein [Jiangella mangrovi]MBB5788915.1 hypothetical protein [Jiangella mangrovi]
MAPVKRRFNATITAVALVSALLSVLLIPAATGSPSAAPARPQPAAAATSGSEANCQPGDRPESGLQGGVPGFERQAPLGFQGFWCAMGIVGQNTLRDRGAFGSTAFVNNGEYGFCNYSSMRNPSDPEDPDTGTMVLDLTVPSEPTIVDILRTPAMMQSYSALQTESGFLAGAYQNAKPFDIYDVNDCLNPSFQGFTMTAGGNHDGWLTPDGTTYYGVQFGGGSPLSNPLDEDIHVLDVSDPTDPKQLLTWNRVGTYGTGDLPPEIRDLTAPTYNFHDASTNEDGTRLYIALYGGTQPLGGGGGEPGRCANGLMVLDSSDVAERRPNPKLEFVSFLSWCDEPDPGGYEDGSTAASHATVYAKHQNGKEYVITTDEGPALTGSAQGACRQLTYARLIDISDENAPRTVPGSRWTPEVNEAENCQTLLDQNYHAGMTHYFAVDDRDGFRYVFYASSNQGIRVVDYLDPENPEEVAYFMAPRHPTLTSVTGTDYTRPDAPYDPQNCFIHTGWNQNGLIILEITDPEHNPCMRKTVQGAGMVTGDNGERVRFDLQARRTDSGIMGGLTVRGTGGSRGDVPDVEVDDLTFLGSPRDRCGTVPSTANSLQLDGTGTIDGVDAAFRICVQDNARSGQGKADRVHVVCTSGCDWSLTGELRGGTINVRGEHGERFSAPPPPPAPRPAQPLPPPVEMPEDD